MAGTPDPRVGTDLGPYRIERVLGRGGMGVVYLAMQTSLGRRVALKVLAPALVDEEAFRQRFIRESQMAAAIDHPNILPIYEAGAVEGTYFLAMRYVEGTDLEGRLRTGPLTPLGTIQLLAQVASALDAAGDVGLVHRDVKPANILIASGKGMERADHAYLSDFGLTKHRGSQSGLTQSGAFMGTLDYIAPEQVEGREVDGRTDQYSLACVAFHCLAGRTPFPRDTDIAIAMAHLHDAPPSATALRPEVPSAADAVLARGMAKTPDERFPTSEAFVGALRQALGLRPTEPHPMPTTPPASKRPLVVVIASMAVVAAVVGVTLTLNSGVATEPNAPTAAAVGGGSPSSVAAASDQATEAAAASPFTLLESSLVLSLPEEAAPECQRGDGALLPTRQGPSVKPRADVVCRLLGGTGPDEIEMWLLPPTDFFNGVEVIEGLTAATGAAEGDCSSQVPAYGGWDNAVDHWGAYLCMTAADGTANFYWSRDDKRALYRMTESSGDVATLHQWWLDHRESITP